MKRPRSSYRDRVKHRTLGLLLVTLVLVLVLAAVVFLRRPPPPKTAATVAREKRETPVIDVAPAPLTDASTALTGTEGVDADGYPTQYVDKVVLEGFLLAARYDDLDKSFEQFQDAAEKDDRHEYWIIDASDAFASGDPSLKARLDAWVAAKPDSFAPYLARGAYLTHFGFVSRGEAWAKDTAKEDFEAMKQAFAPAQADLTRALSIRPKLVAAKRFQVVMGIDIMTRREVQVIVDDATTICPGCFQIRAAYLMNATPRWGGSYPEMAVYAKNVNVAPNPRLRLLPGYVDWDKARVALEKKDNAGALAAIERACAFGDGADFLQMRGIVHAVANDWGAAKQDFDRAIAIRPGQPEYLANRSNAEVAIQAYEAAAADELTALRIDPTDETARKGYKGATEGIVYRAREVQATGNDAEALRLYDLAADLQPANHDVDKRRAWLLAGGSDAAIPSPSAAASMTANVPDDIDQVRRMDYALSRARRFPEILNLWNAYIAKHPDDGRAYLERSGTYYNLGKRDLANADARKACDLGFNEGCHYARQTAK